MGAGTSVGQRTQRNVRVSTKLMFDYQLLTAMIVMLIVGLVILYSASWNYSLQMYDSGTALLLKQILHILVGGAACLALTFFDYHRLRAFSVLMIVLSIGALLFLVVDPFHSESANGYTRSVLSSGSVQPSELAKISLIIFLSFWFSMEENMLNHDWFRFIVLIALIVVMGLLTLVQPDVSAAMCIVVFGIMMYFIYGGNIVLIVVLGFILAVLLVVAYLFTDKVGNRFGDYVGGFSTPAGASYHIRRSYNAIMNGGFFGVGIGKSVSKITGLPYAWTDSIFAVILEETGVFGGAAVIFGYLYILYRGYVIFKGAPDDFGKLLAAGISSWIFIEASINVCVMLNLLPFAGNALPLISYGGSSLACTMAGFGILLNISRVSAREAIKKERNEPDEVIDLRRRDWGWRVSRPGSSSDN